MNKITAFLVIVITALSFILGATMQSKAQDKSFQGIVPFMTGGNHLGLFDQSNGKIYMYDENLSQCVFIGQMTALGQPIQPVTSPTSQ